MIRAYNDDHYISLPYAINDGNWHQLVVSLQGQRISVYLDGRLAGTTDFNSTPNTTGTPVSRFTLCSPDAHSPATNALPARRVPTLYGMGGRQL